MAGGAAARYQSPGGTRTGEFICRFFRLGLGEEVVAFLGVFFSEGPGLGPSASAVDLTSPHRGQRRVSAAAAPSGSLETGLSGSWVLAGWQRGQEAVPLSFRMALGDRMWYSWPVY